MNPDAVTHVVNPKGLLNAKFQPHVAASSSIRRRTTMTEHGSVLRPDEQHPKRGMWVRYGNRTGILTNLEAGDIATVMLVDDQDGTNSLEVHTPGSQIRQAYFEELPVARRPSYADAARFGYVRKPA